LPENVKTARTDNSDIHRRDNLPIKWGLDPFKWVRKRKIPPDPKRVVEAFARIGYRLEEAIADVIDNAIDAHAKHVVIRFFLSNSSIQRSAAGSRPGCAMRPFNFPWITRVMSAIWPGMNSPPFAAPRS
jgi:hypothetical protein